MVELKVLCFMSNSIIIGKYIPISRCPCLYVVIILLSYMGTFLRRKTFFHSILLLTKFINMELSRHLKLDAR